MNINRMLRRKEVKDHVFMQVCVCVCLFLQKKKKEAKNAETQIHIRINLEFFEKYKCAGVAFFFKLQVCF